MFIWVLGIVFDAVVLIADVAEAVVGERVVRAVVEEVTEEFEEEMIDEVELII